VDMDVSEKVLVLLGMLFDPLVTLKRRADKKKKKAIEEAQQAQEGLYDKVKDPNLRKSLSTLTPGQLETLHPEELKNLGTNISIASSSSSPLPPIARTTFPITQALSPIHPYPNYNYVSNNNTTIQASPSSASPAILPPVPPKLMEDSPQTKIAKSIVSYIISLEKKKKISVKVCTILRKIMREEENRARKELITIYNTTHTEEEYFIQDVYELLKDHDYVID